MNVMIFRGTSAANGEVIVCEIDDGKPILDGYFDDDERDIDYYDVTVAQLPLAFTLLELS